MAITQQPSNNVRTEPTLFITQRGESAMRKVRAITAGLLLVLGATAGSASAQSLEMLVGPELASVVSPMVAPLSHGISPFDQSALTTLINARMTNFYNSLPPSWVRFDPNALAAGSQVSQALFSLHAQNLFAPFPSRDPRCPTPYGYLYSGSIILCGGFSK
jgi:hypothetical protein